MATFSSFKDMFKWNKQLFEDDFNEGKLYTVKHKKDLGNKTEIETNIKVNESSGSSHKLSADHKVKGKVSEFGGVSWEAKMADSGKVEYKQDFNYLDKEVDGLQGVIVHHDCNLNVAKKGMTNKVGVSWSNDQFKTKNTVSELGSVPVFESESSW